MQKLGYLFFGLVLVTIVVLNQYVNWGTLVVRSPQTISVIGTAQSQEQNQLATFYAGAVAVNQDKQAAIDEVNSKVEEVLAKIKDFGVDSADIQTQNLSVYQEQEQYYQDGAQRYRPGSWRANNSLTIKFREVNRSSELVTLLAESGLTDISGPSFSMDNSSEAQTKLLAAAVQNAREKADLLAAEEDKQVYKILSIAEGVSSGEAYPVYARQMGGGGGAPVEAGSTTVSTSVTVTFEVR